MMLWKSLGFWFVLLIVAVASGGLREKLLKPRMGELRAHQAGTVFVCVIFFGLIALFVRWTVPSERDALSIGGSWMVMTILFEILMVRVWMRKPWSTVFADYNVVKGRLWVLVLFTTLFGPWIASRILH
jgi:hypothetical protein